ncbi:MAG: hypothetical protein SGJ27_20565, partial [Candidatus Melainabacteria bacterium]|nr:hypothetical protein [Candidatus Melainabacteria bacterium]
MNFTALQDISPQTLCWIIAGVVLLLAGFSWWRFDVAFKFKTRYNNAKQALENALIRTESTSKLLTANPVGLALQAPNFSGKTKTEYERVRLTWLNWINLRAFAHERLARAHLLFKQNQKRPWWRFFGCGKLKLAVAVLTEEQVAGACQSLPQQVLGALAAHASAQGTTASLPQVIEREEQAIVNSFAAFTKTLADADQTRREFELEFSNPVEEERAGIDGLRSNLLVAGLALSPYEERLTEITRVRDQLFKQLGEDPLTVTAQATSALKQKIGLLRRSLLDATRYKVDLEALRARHRKVSEEAGAMRKSEPVSAIAAVRFTVKHTLNEPDFEILPLLSECAGALQDLDSSLLDGHLIKFARAVEQVNQNVARCEEMFGKIIADKQLADERYAEINLLSRVADLEFDQPYHAGLSAEYAAQKWNAAANAADTLLKRCQSRAAVRKASDELDEHLSALAKRIRWHAAVVSQSLEDRLGEVEAEAALCRASAFAANPSV